ncbi:MAG: L,D-transpeptidase [Actinomycetota bacterium]|nr:L,D-transpeptidase [Actinomycetota bacterium]
MGSLAAGSMRWRLCVVGAATLVAVVTPAAGGPTTGDPVAVGPQVRDVAGNGVAVYGEVADRDAGRHRRRAGHVPTDPPAVPRRTGSGKRVVFDAGQQRVWLVGAKGRVQRSYPVSGSRYDNLDAGRYRVYSRSRHAVSFTYAQTMRFMVRFATGRRAAIGFHDIPVDRRGRPVQTRAELGRPLSAGCIRQARADARALWRFARVGTVVVVTD